MPYFKPSKDYAEMATEWNKMRKTAAGQKAVKDAGTLFLPDFYPPDPLRYKGYLARAVFYNYVWWAITVLHGSVFRRPPVVELPKPIEYVRKGVDPMGNTLDQLMKRVVYELITVSRVGLLTDPAPPPSGSEVSPKNSTGIVVYLTEAIWTVKVRRFPDGYKVSTVLLREVVDISPDPLKEEYEGRFRELGLDALGRYYQKVYNDAGELLSGPVYPRDSRGQLWDYIPFEIGGAAENGVTIDKPLLLDIANINLAHYVNSADWEDCLHKYASKTLFVGSEMSADEFNRAIPGGVKLGTEDGHFLGKGGWAELVGLDENEALPKEMEAKKKQIVGLGGQFMEGQISGDRTAEEARIEAGQQASALGTLVGNAEEILIKSLRHVARFEGANPDEVKIVFNRVFYDKVLASAEILALDSLTVNKTLPKKVVRHNVRLAGYVPAGMTDDDMDAAISEEGL